MTSRLCRTGPVKVVPGRSGPASLWLLIETAAPAPAQGTARSPVWHLEASRPYGQIIPSNQKGENDLVDEMNLTSATYRPCRAGALRSFRRCAAVQRLCRSRLHEFINAGTVSPRCAGVGKSGLAAGRPNPSLLRSDAPPQMICSGQYERGSRWSRVLVLIPPPLYTKRPTAGVVGGLRQAPLVAGV